MGWVQKGQEGGDSGRAWGVLSRQEARTGGVSTIKKGHSENKQTPEKVQKSEQKQKHSDSVLENKIKLRKSTLTVEQIACHMENNRRENERTSGKCGTLGHHRPPEGPRAQGVAPTPTLWSPGQVP